MNRKELGEAVEQSSSVLGTDFAGSKASNGSVRKRKRGGPERSTGGSSKRRRDSKRSARSDASSISSRSHASSRSRRSSLGDAGGDMLRPPPIPDIPPGRTEVIMPCPEIPEPGWTVRVRARKKVRPAPGAPLVDRVFLSPEGKTVQRWKDVVRIVLEGASVGGDAGASSAPPPRRRSTHPAEMKELASTTTGLSAARKKSDFLHPQVALVKDMSASLEHILLAGGRVQAREGICKEFLATDSVLGGGGGGEAEDKGASRRGSVVLDEKVTQRLSDSMLYDSVIAQGLASDDDNINVKSEDPKECLPTSRERELEPRTSMNGNYHLFLDETFPVNDPVKYNNMIRERHTYYTSQGSDRHWDEEYGDGVDPMVFVRECRRRCVIAPSNGVEDDGSSAQKANRDIDAPSVLAKNYTSSLVQRCWDRAVHAASGTVAFNATSGHHEGSTTGFDTEKDVKKYATSLQNPLVVDSILQREAMYAVDHLLDALFSKSSDLMKMHEAFQTTNQKVDWRHVVNYLQKVSRQDEPVQQCAHSPEQEINEKGQAVLDQVSLKALSMRLIERYGNASQEMPL